MRYCAITSTFAKLLLIKSSSYTLRLLQIMEEITFAIQFPAVSKVIHSETIELVIFHAAVLENIKYRKMIKT